MNKHLTKEIERQRGHIDLGQRSIESLSSCPRCKNSNSMALSVKGMKCLSCGWESGQ